MASPQEKVFIQLIQEHTGIIRKVIRLYVDDTEDRQDAEQEILLQAWKSFAGFNGKSAFSTWLYRVSLNTVLTFQQKAKKVKELKKNAPLPDQDNTTASYDRSELLYQLIKELKEIDRMLMSLHLDGYANQEIAEITGLKANHVNVKLHRLKQQLIDQLSSKKTV